MIDYSKTEAMQLLQEKLGWVYYGGKHYESIYTRFFQAHILPEKFGYDKRKAHLSTLINSGEITREEALKELEKPTCPAELLREDKTFALKKLGLTEEQFQEIMDLPHKTIHDYPSYETTWYFKMARSLMRRLR